MSQLAKVDTTAQKYYLPSSQKDAEGNDVPVEDQAWVVVRLGKLLAGDIATISDVASDFGIGLAVLAARIQEWSMVEEDGTPTPITYQNVCRMEMQDVGFLIGEINPSGASVNPLSDPKKNLDSLDISTP